MVVVEVVVREKVERGVCGCWESWYEVEPWESPLNFGARASDAGVAPSLLLAGAKPPHSSTFTHSSELLLHNATHPETPAAPLPTAAASFPPRIVTRLGGRLLAHVAPLPRGYLCRPHH